MSKSKEDGDGESKDMGSDGEDRGRSETPTPEQAEDEVYKVMCLGDPYKFPGSKTYFRTSVLPYLKTILN